MTPLTTIKIEDHYGDNIKDSLNRKIIVPKNNIYKPKGFVEIYENINSNNLQLVGKSNLVVYLGREYMTSRLVNINNSNITPTRDEFLCWLGLGSGGVDISDPLTPIAPESTDTDLTTEIPINATDSTCADFHDGAYYKHPFDSIIFEQDVYNSNSWLILKNTIVIGNSDANGYNLSEAGLFTAESDAGGYSGQFSLFARVTFPSLTKSIDRRFTFIWYIYL